MFCCSVTVLCVISGYILAPYKGTTLYIMTKFHADLSQTTSIHPGEISVNYLENTWMEWPEIWHADVSWQPPGMLRFWLGSVDICNFCTIFDLVKQNKFEVWYLFFWKMHGKNSLKYGKQILTTLRTDWILVKVCWFSWCWCKFHLMKLVKFGVIEWMTWNLTCRCILTTFRTD